MNALSTLCTPPLSLSPLFLIHTHAHTHTNNTPCASCTAGGSASPYEKPTAVYAAAAEWAAGPAAAAACDACACGGGLSACVCAGRRGGGSRGASSSLPESLLSSSEDLPALPEAAQDKDKRVCGVSRVRNRRAKGGTRAQRGTRGRREEGTVFVSFECTQPQSETVLLCLDEGRREDKARTPRLHHSNCSHATNAGVLILSGLPLCSSPAP